MRVATRRRACLATLLSGAAVVAAGAACSSATGSDRPAPDGLVDAGPREDTRGAAPLHPSDGGAGTARDANPETDGSTSEAGTDDGAAPACGSADGGIDPSFGEGGVAWFAPSTAEWEGVHAGALATAPNGDLFAGISRGATVVRLDRDGHAAWLRSVGEPDAYLRVAGVAVASDGAVVLGATRAVEPGRYRVFVARRLASGELDPAFGDGGISPPSTRPLTARGGIVVQRTGAFVVAAHTDYLTIALAGFRPDGQPDPTFAPDAGGGVSEVERLTASPARLLVLPDDRLLVLGLLGTGAPVLVRFMPNGELDRTFGNDGTGIVKPDIPGPVYQRWADAALDAAGRVVVAGYAAPASFPDETRDFIVARFLADGALDRSFGANGSVVSDFGRGDAAQAVAVLPSGDIVVAGSVGQWFDRSAGRDIRGSLAVVRYRPNGALDPTFGAGGVAELPVPLAANEYGWSDVTLVRDPSAPCAVLAGALIASTPSGMRGGAVRVGR